MNCELFNEVVTVPDWESIGDADPVDAGDPWSVWTERLQLPVLASIIHPDPVPTVPSIRMIVDGVHVDDSPFAYVTSAFEIQLAMGAVVATFDVQVQSPGIIQNVTVTLSSGATRTRQLISTQQLRDDMTISLEITQQIAGEITEYRTCATITDGTQSITVVDYSHTLPAFAGGDFRITATESDPYIVSAIATIVQSDTHPSCPAPACVPPCEYRCDGQRITGISVTISGLADSTSLITQREETEAGIPVMAEYLETWDGLASLNGTYTFPIDFNPAETNGDKCWIRNQHATVVDVQYVRNRRSVPLGDPMSGTYATLDDEIHQHVIYSDGTMGFLNVATGASFGNGVNVPWREFDLALMEDNPDLFGLGGDMFATGDMDPDNDDCIVKSYTSSGGENCWRQSELVAGPGHGTDNCTNAAPHFGAILRCEYMF